MVPRWYGSQISADCRNKLFSFEHDIGGKNLLVTFCEKQKRECSCSLCVIFKLYPKLYLVCEFKHYITFKSAHGFALATSTNTSVYKVLRSVIIELIFKR